MKKIEMTVVKMKVPMFIVDVPCDRFEWKHQCRVVHRRARPFAKCGCPHRYRRSNAIFPWVPNSIPVAALRVQGLRFLFHLCVPRKSLASGSNSSAIGLQIQKYLYVATQLPFPQKLGPPRENRITMHLLHPAAHPLATAKRDD